MNLNKQSRQLLNFLKKQNQMLKDDIRQLRQILKINQSALQLSLIYKKEQNYEKIIPPLIKLLYEQNLRLNKKIEQLKKQIEMNMCQALISQQIACASTEHEILLTNQLKEKLIKLKKQLVIKQNKILQLTKVSNNHNMGQKQKLSLNDARILIEYTDMNKVAKKLKDAVDKVNQQLDQKKQEVANLRQGRDQLFKLNLILTKQLNELKLLTSCQTTKSNRRNSSNTKIQISSSIRNSTNQSYQHNNDLSKYIKLQKKITTDQHQDIYQFEDNQNKSNNKNQIQDQQSDNDEGFSSSQYNSDSDENEGFENMEIEEYNDENNKSYNQRDNQKIGMQNFKKIQKHGKVNKTMNLGMKKIDLIRKPDDNDNDDQQKYNQNNKMNLTLNLADNKNKLNSLKLSLKNSQNNTYKNQQKPKFIIPKLQLSKAKQIQTLIVKKINYDQKKKKQSQNNNGVVKQQKYRKIQQQIQCIKSKLGTLMMQKLNLQREVIFMKRMLTELQNRNSLLVSMRKQEQQEQKYIKKRKNYQQENKETLLDICRDVTMNQRLRNVVLGKEMLRKREVECWEW